jgi:hypothetical protein
MMENFVVHEKHETHEKSLLLVESVRAVRVFRGHMVFPDLMRPDSDTVFTFTPNHP